MVDFERDMDRRERVRDFHTDSSDRYPPDFLKTSKEGRSYEDLQVPDKLRMRELTRKIDEWERFIYEWEAFIRHAAVATFTGESLTSDTPVTHTLGAVPSDVIFGLPGTATALPGEVLSVGGNIEQQPPSFWRGATMWTRTKVYLRANQACRVMVYFIK